MRSSTGRVWDWRLPPAGLRGKTLGANELGRVDRISNVCDWRAGRPRGEPNLGRERPEAVSTGDGNPITFGTNGSGAVNCRAARSFEAPVIREDVRGGSGADESSR